MALMHFGYTEPAMIGRSESSVMSNNKITTNSSSKESATQKRISYVKLVLLSVCMGFILEAGQLFGAPIASVMNLGDWSKKAVLIYALLFFVVGWFAVRFNWIARARKALLIAKAFFKEYGRRLAVCIVVSIVLSVAVDVLVTVFTGFSEPLPFGLFIFSLFLYASLVIGFRKFVAVKMEWFFLVCILSLGMGVVVLSPIETSYSFDDQIHYGNSTALSYLDNREFTESDQSILEPAYRDVNNMPKEEFEVKELLESWESFQEGIYAPLDGYNNSASYKNSLSSYQSLGYIPSATGLYLGRLLHMPYALTFDLGRFSNLLFFSLVVFMGMRKLESKKTVACVVMLLPATVFLACNYSYDPWLTGLLFYAVASFMGILQSGKEINRSDVIKILAAFLLGLGPKAIYFPLLFILLLAPKNQFTGNISVRTYRIAVLATAFVALASFALPMVIGGVGSDVRGGSDVNASAQIKGILANPLGYCGILVSYARVYLDIFNAIGYTTNLGYLNSVFCLAPLFYVWLVISALLDNGFEENHSFSNLKCILVSLGTVVLALFGIFSALYITFTPVGSFTIAGVHGRYLTPLLFVFLAFCLNFRLPRCISRETSSLIVLSVSALGLYTVFFVLFVSIWVG